MRSAVSRNEMFCTNARCVCTGALNIIIALLFPIGMCVFAVFGVHFSHPYCLYCYTIAQLHVPGAQCTPLTAMRTMFDAACASYSNISDRAFMKPLMEMMIIALSACTCRHAVCVIGDVIRQEQLSEAATRRRWWIPTAWIRGDADMPGLNVRWWELLLLFSCHNFCLCFSSLNCRKLNL